MYISQPPLPFLNIRLQDINGRTVSLLPLLALCELFPDKIVNALAYDISQEDFFHLGIHGLVTCYKPRIHKGRPDCKVCPRYLDTIADIPRAETDGKPQVPEIIEDALREGLKIRSNG